MVQTGRYPTHTCLVMNWVDMRPSEVGIAEVFGAAGYDTGFIGKWHLAAGRLRHAGLMPPEKAAPPRDPEPEFVPPGEARAGYRHWEAHNFHSDFAHAFYYRDTPERLIMPRYETDAETDMAISFIRRHADGGPPFFLMVAPHPPHPPWRPDQTPEGALARDTIAVFTSDHGEMLWSHGRRNKMVFYEEAIRIPLAIRWPGVIPAGVRSDALYEPIDHMPTLLALAGLAAPATCDGLDLSPAARGDGSEDAGGRSAALLAEAHDDVRPGSSYVEWFTEDRRILRTGLTTSSGSGPRSPSRP